MSPRARKTRREHFPPGPKGDAQYDNMKNRRNEATRKCRGIQKKQRVNLTLENPLLRAEIEELETQKVKDGNEIKELTAEVEEMAAKVKELELNWQAAMMENEKLKKAAAATCPPRVGKKLMQLKPKPKANENIEIDWNNLSVDLCLSPAVMPDMRFWAQVTDGQLEQGQEPQPNFEVAEEVALVKNSSCNGNSDEEQLAQ
jgi:hypothetical protein